MRSPKVFPLHAFSCTVLVLAAACWPLRASAQRAARCDNAQRVRSVKFSGSPHFDAVTLAASIITHEPSVMTRWFHRGTAPCLDSLELRRDALRLAVMHRQVGWFQASVVPVVDRRPNGVRLRFAITPGPEAILDTIVIQGLPEPTGDGPAFEAPLRALENERFDRTRADAVIERVVAQLRDAGYARATSPRSLVTIDSAAARATLALAFSPGRMVTVGDVQIEVQPLRDGHPRVATAAVERLVAIHPGDQFRASAILDAQRDLYRSESFRLVLIDTLTPLNAASDSVLDLRVAVAEARTRAARVGLGWATQDCIRMQGRIVDRGFLGVGRRVELSARASKIGVGAPAGFAPALCSGALRVDPFSQKLNYYVGTTLTNTRLFGLPIQPTLTVYSERRGEPFAYLRETGVGALIELSRQFTARTSGTAGVQYENGRTITDPVISCSRFGQCRPQDFALSLFGRGVGIVSTGAAHDHTNDLVNPSRGWRVRGDVRAGESASDSVQSLRFYRGTGELSTYLRFAGGVIASRVQLARAFAPGAELVDGSPLLPQQERIFSGGQSSVRGYQQNLLGPIVYVVSDVKPETVGPNGERVVVVKDGAGYDRAVPRGGTAMFVANLEWRRGFRFFAEELQFAAFVDAGNVWESDTEGFRWGNLRATPGLGLRIVTPLGPFLVDVGYRPYEPVAGRALFFTSGDAQGSAGQILCASPRNAALSRGLAIFDCPSTYRPPSSRGILSRLTFHFGLGQAF
ncbi:outer membrane protein assembly factor [Gemmatimonas sp.]|jgi:outer membrane protein insertion porin family/translocation and assembly module TamA|uniref:outer membrane protein assembly factor n=1 Tax=Gemmatimonas sp. TaxID=1962908 RepID=UPI0037BE7517